MIIILGKVFSIKMNKTVIVLIKKILKIKIYNKIVFSFSKIFAHDNFNFCSINDVVILVQNKPISKKKFWKIIKII